MMLNAKLKRTDGTRLHCEPEMTHGHILITKQCKGKERKEGKL